MTEDMLLTEARRIPRVMCGLELVRRITECGYDALLVGGCVRDLVLWKMGMERGESSNTIPSIHDVDIATNMPIDVLKQMFRCASNGGEEHGTILVCGGSPISRVDEYYEVTQFRSDGDYSDGRHPDSVSWASSFREDAARRDFTMNAMGLDSSFHVVDYYGGIDDIKSGKLRTVGDPGERFSEDVLRVVRMCRFAARFSLEIPHDVFHAAQVASSGLNSVSMERIHDEIEKCAGYGIGCLAEMVRLMAAGIGQNISDLVDWYNAPIWLKNLVGILGRNAVVPAFPVLIESVEAMRQFKCSREDISALAFISRFYKCYSEGSLNLVDKVDGVCDRRWPAFVNYVLSRQRSCMITKKDEERFCSYEAEWPTKKDISEAIGKRGVKPGRVFGRIIRVARMRVYDHKERGRAVTEEWFNKLVDESIKECTA